MASAAASRDLSSPTARATPTATSTTPPQIAVDGLAVVVTNDLVVRSLPEISARSVMDPRTLNEGKVLFVLDGPVAADGFEWYQVVPFDTGDVAYPAPELGWVAAGRGREVWIAPEAAMEYRLCRGQRAEEVLGGPALVHLGCIGNKAISMVGRVTECGEATGGGITPVWLSARSCQLVGLDACELGCGRGMHHEEDVFAVFAPYIGKVVRVTGHFDDPAAQTCRSIYGDDAATQTLAVLSCRTSFVVTEIEEAAD